VVEAMRKRTDRRIGDLLDDNHALDAGEQDELVQAAEWRCLWGCITGAKQKYRAAGKRQSVACACAF